MENVSVEEYELLKRAFRFATLKIALDNCLCEICTLEDTSFCDKTVINNTSCMEKWANAIMDSARRNDL